MKTLSALGIAAACVGGARASTLPDCTKAPLSQNKICDTTATPRERAAALVAAMQNSEKLVNLVRWASQPQC
jgi:beta-D-xylosidase 4